MVVFITNTQDYACKSGYICISAGTASGVRGKAGQYGNNDRPGHTSTRRVLSGCFSVTGWSKRYGSGCTAIMDPHIMCQIFSLYNSLPDVSSGPLSAMAHGLTWL